MEVTNPSKSAPLGGDHRTLTLRHRMKDKLRNTGCPEDVSLAILGHSTNTVAANYGSGYALEVMRGHMEKVWSGQC
jgi:hypothetical protein